ncbi:glycosyltransferase [Paenibacillus spiritus]|uniref:Glycosyltransferase n=1 Tax=Paenibacillus spiritus TaxID=2496557 RepID=A0A5J5FWH4_9BACL|nr:MULTISPECIES: glycosyltransferase [Paenibacillus]KAA8997970.1 glycosyltransferase [Paenibacillus spiritus]
MPKLTPPISVIIPIYNVERYLEECLNSVLDQTLPGIEIICINDGSTDGSLEILQKYEARYSHLVTISQSNQGVAAARNRGLLMASGEYVAFMDPDDYYPDNDILECLYTNAINHNALICGGSFSLLDNGNIIENFQSWYQDYRFKSDGMIAFEDYQFPYGFTRFLYQLEFLRNHSISFPTYNYFEDPPFFVKAAIQAKQFYALSKVTYRYRQGHKNPAIPTHKWGDFAAGLLDLLTLSKKHNLYKLHNIVVKIVYLDLFRPFYKQVATGRNSSGMLLEEIEQAINMEWLTEEQRLMADRFPLKHAHLEIFAKENIELQKKFNRFLQGGNPIIIYGAGCIGQKVAMYIQEIQHVHLVGYAVTSAVGNPREIEGITVREIRDLAELCPTASVVLATTDSFQNEIMATLDTLGFQQIWPIEYRRFQLFNTSKEN